MAERLEVRRSLSTKLILGFLVVALPSVAVIGGISFYAFRDLAQVNRQFREISRSLEAVRDLEAAVARAVTPLGGFLLHSTPAEDQRFAFLMKGIEARLESCADAACHGTSRQPREMAQSLVPYIQGIRSQASTIFTATDSRRAADKLRLFREINQQSEEASTRLQRMSSALLLRVESLQRKSQEVSRRAISLIVASITLVVVLAVLMAYFISRRLLRPVQALLVGTRHVTEGDMRYRVAIVERDEIGELAQSFNAMAQEIQEYRGRLERMVQAKSAELKQAQDSLLQSEKLASIGLLASGVAHELNNPLTSILMNINLLMEEVEDRPDLHRELKRISDDTLRCQRIIDELRDFSRQHELAISPSDINGVVQEALGLIDHQLKLQGITLSQEFCPRAPPIPCDPDRIQQVLMNVFVNAIQAMPQGGRLTVSTALQEGLAEIAVRDSGPGIPRQIRGKIFDPFFTTKSGGTGLGLSIAYRIMDEHGGRVEIESLTEEEIGPGREETSGTTVRLLLPMTGLLPAVRL